VVASSKLGQIFPKYPFKGTRLALISNILKRSKSGQLQFLSEITGDQ
jgi:hypothetical protein